VTLDWSYSTGVLAYAGVVDQQSRDNAAYRDTSMQVTR
jgi:hypothetical protein